MRRQGAEEEELQRMEEEQERELAATRLQGMIRSRAARMQVDAKRKDRDFKLKSAKQQHEQSQRELLALKLQSIYRGNKERAKFKAMRDAIEAERIARGEAAAQVGASSEGEWIEYFDEASGYPYWFNTATNESRWEDPRGGTDGYGTTGSVTDYASDNYEANYAYQEGYYDESGEWVEGGYYDENGTWHGDSEYFNAEFVDDDGDGIDDRAQLGYEGYNEKGIDSDWATSADESGYEYEDEPQDGWLEYYDDGYEQSYFYNVMTQETVWESPEGFVSKYTDGAKPPTIS